MDSITSLFSGILGEAGKILSSVGVNHTFWYLFIIFIIASFIMSRLVFKPYLDAYEKREALTIGNEEDAKELIVKANLLEEQFSEKAKDLNGKIKEMFFSAKQKIEQESLEQLSKAKKENESNFEKEIIVLEKQVISAKEELMKEASGMTSLIRNKMLGGF